MSGYGGGGFGQNPFGMNQGFGYNPWAQSPFNNMYWGMGGYQFPWWMLQQGQGAAGGAAQPGTGDPSGGAVAPNPGGAYTGTGDPSGGSGVPNPGGDYTGTGDPSGGGTYPPPTDAQHQGGAALTLEQVMHGLTGA